MLKKLFKDVEVYEEDIYLGNKGYYNTIKAGSIAWYIIKTIQVLILFIAVMLPYLMAIIIASCLGF